MRNAFASLALILLTLPAAGKSKDVCANKGTDLVFPKGHKFIILQYHGGTDTFEIQSQQFPGEGNSTVTLEGLADAVPEIKTRRFEIAKNPDDLIDSTFETKKDLPTLFPREKAARSVCGKK